jgi:transposase
MLAELVRLDRHNHRPVAGDSALSEGLKVLARAHQNLIWERTRHTNRLRNALREYFPAALATFDHLADRDTLAVLAKAATPSEAATLTPGRVRTALRSGGRTRNVDARAQAIVEGLRGEALHAPEPVVAAFAATTRAQVAILTTLNEQIAQLETELRAHFEQHPDADIYLSPNSPGARALYDHHRARGLSHHQALRTLANRLVGLLHGCLRHHTLYDEHAGWSHRNDHQIPIAA